MFQRDYLLRMIEMAAQAMARALRLSREQKPDQAERALAEGYGALAFDRELLRLLDAASVRSQLADEARLELAVRLLACDAELQRHKGAPNAARKRFKAAQRLLAQHSAPPADLSAELARMAHEI